MTFVVSDAARNAQLDAIGTLLEQVGAGNLLLRSATTTFCTLTLPATYPAAASGTLDMTNGGTLSGTTTAGTVDRFIVEQNDLTDVLTGDPGSVATSGGDINLSSVTFGAGDFVTFPKDLDCVWDVQSRCANTTVSNRPED